MKSRFLLSPALAAAALLWHLFLAAPAAAQPGSLDTSLNGNDRGLGYGLGANEAVLTMAVQPDGKALIGGRFSRYNGIPRARLARLTADGGHDTSFGIGNGANGDVLALLVQPDGKIVVGGAFDYVGITTCGRLIRLLASGTADTSFHTCSGANNEVLALAQQPDGKLIVGGSFTAFSDSVHNRLVRLLPNGRPDTTFHTGTGANNSIFVVALQPDGKILIGGAFTSYNGSPVKHLARLLLDGSLDSSFNPSGTGPNERVHALALQPDGGILIGGVFISYNGTYRNRIACLTDTGQLDTSFNPGTGASSGVFALQLQPGGKLLIGGMFTSYNGVSRRGIARLNSSGSLDTGFSPGTGVEEALNSYAPAVYALALLNNQTLIGGDFTQYNKAPAYHVARLFSSGHLDTGYNSGTGAFGVVRAAVVQADGKIVIGGDFNRYDNTFCYGIARLHPDGSLDTTFAAGAGAGSQVNALKLLPDGKLLVGGRFSTFNGQQTGSLVRLFADGSLDPGFSSPAHNVYDFAFQSDGKIVATSQSISGIVLRFYPNGLLDSTFSVPLIYGTYQMNVLVQPDDRILIGGRFNIVNGSPRGRIARLMQDGTLDYTFHSEVGASLPNDSNVPGIALALQPDGKVLIGGSFTSYNGTSRRRLARLHPDGTLDTSFDPGSGANGFVGIIVPHPDNKLLIGGGFTLYNGTSRSRIARLHYDVLSAAPAIPQAALNLFPNPTTGRFTIALPSGAAEPAVVAVYNLLGQQVLQQSIKTGPIAEVDLQGQPAGTYLVRVQLAEQVLVQKVVVQR